MGKQSVRKMIHDRRDNVGKVAKEFAANLREAGDPEERRGVVLEFAHNLMPKKAAAALVERERARADRLDAIEQETADDESATLERIAAANHEADDAIAEANERAELAEAQAEGRAELAEAEARVRIDAAAQMADDAVAAAGETLKLAEKAKADAEKKKK